MSNKKNRGRKRSPRLSNAAEVAQPPEPSYELASGEGLEIPVLDSDEVVRLMAHFFKSQQEILRLARYLNERASEIDDEHARARKAVARIYPLSTDEGFDVVWLAVDSALEKSRALGLGDPEPSQDDIDEMTRAVQVMFESVPEGHGPNYVSAILDSRSRNGSAPVLMSSLLTTLISDFEVLVAGLAKELLNRHPGALSDSEKPYTWAEVSAYSSIEDFRSFVIDRHVDDLLYKSFPDYLTFFKDKFHCEVPASAGLPQVLEIFQRRHVIVHSGGLVSRQYLAKVKSSSAAIGDTLDVDLEYLSTAADHLVTIGLALGSNAARQLFRRAEGDRDRLEADAGNYAFRLLQEERWLAAKTLTEELKIDSFHRSGLALVAKVNGWIARKHLGEMESCRPEIERWDTEPLESRFKLAKLALLGEMQAGLELVQQIRGTMSLPFEYWLSWPLLAELREYEQAQGRAGR